MDKLISEIPVGIIFSKNASDRDYRHFYIKTEAIRNNLIICVSVETGQIIELEQDTVVFEEGKFLDMI